LWNNIATLNEVKLLKNIYIMFVLTDSGQSILLEDVNVAIGIYIGVLMKRLNSDGQQVY
jgi:hypothetical protein